MDGDITEKTKVPLFAVLISVPTLLVGVGWLTAMYEQGVQATKVNERQDAELKELNRLSVETHDGVMELKETIRLRCR